MNRVVRFEPQQADADFVNREYEIILNSLYDKVIVTDGSGIILRCSASAERYLGVPVREIVGKHVSQLEREGVYSRSVTTLVLKTKRKQTIVQDTQRGHRLVVTGTPVMDDQGNIVRVVCTSRDITEQHQLRQLLDETRNLVARYQKELVSLRSGGDSGAELLAASPAMRKVLDLIERLAWVDSTVLVLGESGVGKEVVARCLHKAGQRAHGSFVKVDCGAIPEGLLESELFGYEPGAFTGARRGGKTGVIELANGGTLFLDEIAEIPLSLQPKLLRLLQEKTIVRIGGGTPVKVDARIIAATNRDLSAMVVEGRFRDDLYYRVNVFPIMVPPLRKRPEDIPLLARSFLAQLNSRYLTERRLTDNALALLERYTWPGNVRELQNVIERAYVMTEKDEIDATVIQSLIPARQRQECSPKRLPPKGSSERFGVLVDGILPLADAVAEAERQVLVNAATLGSTHKMAAALGVSQPTIVRKLKKYKIRGNQGNRGRT